MATERYEYGVETVNGHDAWALMCACADGDAGAAAALLTKDARLANAQYWYQFPIHLAVREGHAAVVKQLLDAGAEPGQSRFMYSAWDKLLDIAQHRGYRDVHAVLEAEMKRRFRYDAGFVPLKQAIVARDLAKVRAVLAERPPLLHASDAFGNGPIHWAALTRQLAMIDEFVGRGGDIHARRADGQTPLHLSINGDYWFRAGRDLTDASIRSSHVVTGFLLAKGAAIDLCIAAAIGDRETAERLLAADPGAAARLGPPQKSPLTYAAGASNLGMVKLLLDHGAKPSAAEQNCPRGGALFAACAAGNREMVELLLQHGADANGGSDSSGTCLTIVEHVRSTACQEIQTLLRQHGARTPVWHMTRDELLDALRRNDPVIHDGGEVGGDWGTFIQSLFDRFETDAELIKLYLDAAGDEPIRQLTTNHLSLKSAAVIDLLAAHGLDVNRPDWRGRTFLHSAAEGGHLEAAAALLKHGAAIDAVDVEFSVTPLGAAARSNKPEMVKFLLDRGADPRAPEDRTWATPFALAAQSGHAEITEALKRAGVQG